MNHTKPMVMDQDPYEALFNITEPAVLAPTSPVLEQAVLRRDPQTELHQALSEVLGLVRLVQIRLLTWRKAGDHWSASSSGRVHHVPGSVDG